MFTSLKEKFRTAREEAARDLKAIHVASTDPRLVLDAAFAEVMDQSETAQHDESGHVIAFYLTQVVRNPAGEYFLLKTTDKRPYVKHLSQGRAKLVLKAKYRPPGQPL
jgi:hypothetical protein